MPTNSLTRVGRSIYSHRSARVRTPLVAALVVAAMVSLGAYRMWTAQALGRSQAAPLSAEVKVGRFVHDVVERGEVHSSSNVEVRCEVRARGSSGTAILEIVPEGTYVQPGDFLVKLDDAQLQAELVAQQIDCNNGHAMVVQAETTVETAKLALKEYESGRFKQEEEQLQSEIFVAEENLRRAEEYYRYSQRLATKGYVTQIQLEADRFAVEKARKELDVARTKLTVLRDYTRQKMLKQLEADIRTAEARLRSQQESYQLELAKLEHIKQQIERCIVTAPSAGQVVYANDTSRSAEVLIEEGRLVRERQVMIRLPDPKRMHVLGKINESRIDLVKSGHEATVRVDAMPGVVLRGTVRRVSEYPLPTSSFSSHIKEYPTEIEIHNPPPGLRPGMNAEVAIRVEKIDNAIQVPVQAVFERGGKHYCLLTDENNDITASQVKIGATNDRFVVVHAGLEEHERVVISPSNYEEKVQLQQARKLDRKALISAGATPADPPKKDKPTALSARAGSVTPGL